MDRNYPFCFTAVVCEGFNEKTKKHEYTLQHGMGFADSYSDAAGIVENHYGDDLMAINKLELFEESGLMIFPKKVIDDYRKDSYAGEPCDYDGNLLSEKNTSREKIGDVIYPDGRREPVYRKCDEPVYTYLNRENMVLREDS